MTDEHSGRDDASLVAEKPAIDRLLDYMWNQEARRPAIDKLIQEYLERVGSPSMHRDPSSHLTPLMGMSFHSRLSLLTAAVLS